MKKKITFICGILVGLFTVFMFFWLVSEKPTNEQATEKNTETMSTDTEHTSHDSFVDVNESESVHTDIMDVYFPEGSLSETQTENTYVSSVLLSDTVDVPFLPYTIDVPAGTISGTGEMTLGTGDSFYAKMYVTSDDVMSVYGRLFRAYFMEGVDSYSCNFVSMTEDTGYINGLSATFYTGYNVVYEENADVIKGYYVIYETPMPEGANICLFALGESADMLADADELFVAMLNSLLKNDSNMEYVQIDPSGLRIVQTTENSFQMALGTATIEVPEYMEEMYFVFNWNNPTNVPIGAYFCLPSGSEYAPSETYSFSGHYVFVISDVEPGTYTFKIKWTGILENIHFHYLDKEMYYYQYLNQDLDGNPIRYN